MSHLTDKTIAALLAGSLDAQERQAAAEHLACCDQCLLRYTQAITPELELSPVRPVAPTVLQRIRARLANRFLNRFGAAAAAVVLALLFWTGGLFTNLVPRRESEPSKLNTALTWFSDGTATVLEHLTEPFHTILTLKSDSKEP